uniref:Uncharacterized protein n=1 Tax=Opuntia streptacantha TaxID=393608 RepID=A0A7C9DX26_OPUST
MGVRHWKTTWKANSTAKQWEYGTGKLRGKQIPQLSKRVKAPLAFRLFLRNLLHSLVVVQWEKWPLIKGPRYNQPTRLITTRCEMSSVLLVALKHLSKWSHLITEYEKSGPKKTADEGVSRQHPCY